MEKLTFINNIIAIVFMACYSYQIVYLILSLIIKPRMVQPAEPHRYAVVISARNEQAVIAQLIQSIRRQKYPKPLIDIFVVADNCSDNTADVARKAGAIVWERFNNQLIGKGYALSFLFKKIRDHYSDRQYEGYFIFDADNLLEENYFSEMNKLFAAGYRIITSYRNSKNFDSNWISAGYSLWFLREARYVNNARMILGTSCAVSGTRFLVHKDIIDRNSGWKHYLLTEDIEFTVECVLQGERIAYCGTAILYDEQPVKFSQSWKQRLRWAKGFLQVFGDYGWRLLKKMILKGSFACFDMTMSIFPAIVLTLFGCAFNLSIALIGIIHYDSQIITMLQSVFKILLNAYCMLFIIGLITLVSEWKKIHCNPRKKILYSFTFPFFMLTYIPISVVALFKKVEWDTIHHNITKSLDDLHL